MRKDNKYIRLILIIIIISIILTSTLSNYAINHSEKQKFGAKSNTIQKETYNNSTKKRRDTLIKSQTNSSIRKNLYVKYDEKYHTKKYNVWNKVLKNNRTEYIASESVVVRRGSTLKLTAPPDSSISIEKGDEGLTHLTSVNKTIKIPEDSTIGKYTITAETEDWSESLDLYVIFDPWRLDISNEKRKTYAYDEESDRSNYTYLYTSTGSIQEAILRPFGEKEPSNDLPDMYKFAIKAASKTNDPTEAAVRLLRIVAQRNEAVPSSFQKEPNYRDASTILFGEGETNLHGKIYPVKGLSLDDAKHLSVNNKSIPGINGLTDEGYSKIINGWCDETSIALTGLLRSIGIPSRIVSAHPSKETDLMGHYMNEVYFEKSIFKTSWNYENSGWYVMDSDSWNAEWYYQKKIGKPIFWMPMGELITTRNNFNRAVKTLFRKNYQYEVEDYYVPPQKILNKESMIKITDQYKNKPIFDIKYGNIEKYIGRGGGDYFKLEINETSKLSIDGYGGTKPKLYINRNNLPALKIFYQGYPPEYPNSNLSDDEIVLPSGSYFVSIFAPDVKEENIKGKKYEGYHLPEEGNPSLIGNYGKYKLTLEKKSGGEPATKPSSIHSLKANLKNDQLKLNWNKPNNGGAKINYYVVYKNGKPLAKVEGTDYIDNNIKEDENYEYQVTAVNCIDESNISDESKVTVSTHITPVYNQKPLQFSASMILISLWIGSYFYLKKIKSY